MDRPDLGLTCSCMKAVIRTGRLNELAQETMTHGDLGLFMNILNRI